MKNHAIKEYFTCFTQKEVENGTIKQHLSFHEKNCLENTNSEKYFLKMVKKSSTSIIVWIINSKCCGEQYEIHLYLSLLRMLDKYIFADDKLLRSMQTGALFYGEII